MLSFKVRVMVAVATLVTQPTSVVAVICSVDSSHGNAVADIDGSVTQESVSISADGLMMAVGTPSYKGNGVPEGGGRTRVYVWQNITSTWQQLGQGIDGEAAYDASDTSVPLPADGGAGAIGARYNSSGNGVSPGHGHTRSSDAQRRASATGVLQQAGVLEDKTFVGAGMQSPIDDVAACADLVDGWATPIRNKAIADYQLASGEATLKAATVTCEGVDEANANARRRRQADGANIQIELVYVVASADTNDLPEEAVAGFKDAIADQIKDATITVATAAGKSITVNVAATEVREVTFSEILDTFLDDYGRIFEFEIDGCATGTSKKGKKEKGKKGKGCKSKKGKSESSKSSKSGKKSSKKSSKSGKAKKSKSASLSKAAAAKITAKMGATDTPSLALAGVAAAVAIVGAAIVNARRSKAVEITAEYAPLMLDSARPPSASID